MWRYAKLCKTLAGLYYTTLDIARLLIEANLSPGDYALQGSAYNMWVLIIRQLEAQGPLGEESIKNIVRQALAANPGNPILDGTLKGAADIANGVNDGPDAGEWKYATSGLQWEKLTGNQSTLLPISFLQEGVLKARSIARVITPEGLGTGFLISKGGLFLTNNHVLRTAKVAAESTVQFNYQKTPAGLAAEPVSFRTDGKLFHTSTQDDWSVVRLIGAPTEKFDYLKLRKISVKKDDFVNIIQHPGGEHKQIALYHNAVTYVDQRVVQYLTDTMPGSSGAGVFNSKWEVVALHHSGGWINEPGIPKPVLRNEGIHINKVLDSLVGLGLDLQ